MKGWPETVLIDIVSIESLAMVPFVVLGNKIDAPTAVSEEELRHQLGLYQTTGKVSSAPHPSSPICSAFSSTALTDETGI